MKKLFSFAAALLLCAATINAEVLWQENFHKGSSTFVDKVKGSSMTPALSYDPWPFASLWKTGYTGVKGAVAPEQYEHEYTEVKSFGVTVRGKKIDNKNAVVLYFLKDKAADKNYVTFKAESIFDVPEGAVLVFDICSIESAGGDLTTMVVKANGKDLKVPATTLGGKLQSSKVTVALEAGPLTELYLAFNKVPSQKAISSIRIETGEGQAIGNITAEGEKAIKVMENGQLVIIRNGVKYNVAGAVVE